MEEQSTEISHYAPRTFMPAAVLGVLAIMLAIFLTAPAPADGSASVPGAPIDLVVAPGNAKLVAGWSPPQDGTEVTGYTVQYKTSAAPDEPGVSNDPATGWVDAPNSGQQTDMEVTGLSNGVGYNVRVRASNSAGAGQWSGTASAAPHEDVVWSAIMTVDVDSESQGDHQSHGCIDSSISTANIAECSTALTEDEFKFDGSTYRWTSLYEATDPWHHASMGFASKVPANSGLRTGTLQIGSKAIYLGETDETRLRWFENGDGWVVPNPSSGGPEFFPTKGQRLPLNLKARIPTTTVVADPPDDGNNPDQGDAPGQPDDGNDPDQGDQPGQPDGGDSPGEGDQPGQPEDGNNPGEGDQPGGEGDGESDDETETGNEPQAQAQTQTPEEIALFQKCREYTQGLEGLRVCVLPVEGRDAVLMLTLSGPAPANGTTVTLATADGQSADSDDFTMPSSITIGEGETSGLIIVNIIADNEEEGYESIHIFACITPGCDPLNPVSGEKYYNHGITIPASTGAGGL